MRCFKHSVDNGKPLLCQLCRTNWGPMGLEILKENQKAFRAKKKEENQANNKTNSVQQMINGATKSNTAGTKVGGGGGSE